MTHKLSLAFLTLFDCTPPEIVRICAEAGYDMVGLRMLPSAEGQPPLPLYDDRAVLKETLAALKDTGMQVSDVDIIRLTPETKVADFTRFAENARELGVRHVLVVGADPERARLVESYGAFCDLAAEHGLTADLEFMPWTQVPDLASAVELVEAVGRDNAAILVDALHLARCDTTLEEVRALPRKWLNYVQFCDGLIEHDPSTEGLIRIARTERLFPGEGEFDLLGLLQAIPEDVILSLEVPNFKLAETMSPAERARHGMKTMRALMAKAGRN